MLKRINKLLLLTTAVVLAGTAVSFGYFYFGDTTSTGKKETIQNTRVDDIYENYETIVSQNHDVTLTDDRYTIYIFPSAEYLKIYQEYLDDPTVNPKPEDFAGYLEPVMNPNGLVDTDVLGNPKYTVKNHPIKNNHSFGGYWKEEPNFFGSLHSKKVNYTFPADNYVQRIDNKYNNGIRFDYNAT